MSDVKAKFVSNICAVVYGLKEEDLSLQIVFLRPEMAEQAEIASKFTAGLVQEAKSDFKNENPSRSIIDDDELDSGILISPTKASAEN